MTLLSVQNDFRKSRNLENGKLWKRHVPKKPCDPPYQILEVLNMGTISSQNMKWESYHFSIQQKESPHPPKQQNIAAEQKNYLGKVLTNVCKKCEFIMSYDFLGFGMVPDTPWIIGYGLLNNRWSINLHTKGKHEKINFRKYYWSWESFKITRDPSKPSVRVSRLPGRALFLSQSNTPPPGMISSVSRHRKSGTNKEHM